jgi:predicted acyl esterase
LTYSSYKDVAINIYEHARQTSPKIKVVVGPFVHAMPEYTNRNPGPGFDSKAEMVRWFNYWLKDDNENDAILNEPDITLFIRTSFTTGIYRYEPQWPIPRQRTRRMYMAKDRMLTEQVPSTIEETRNNDHVDTLEYRPWIGFEGGLWLGGLTENQQPFDEYCLVYQSDPVNETVEIVGFVNVSLQVLIGASTSLSYMIQQEISENEIQIRF